MLYQKTISALIVICISLVIIPKSKSEMYFSLKILEKLIETERLTIKNIKSSLAQVNEFSTRNSIEKFLKSSIKEHKIAIRDIQHYIGNPINAFRLIKRLYVDLMIIEDMLKGNSYYTRSEKGSYPTLEDLDGAAKGIINLVVVYKLNVTELADGTLATNFSRSKKKFVEHVTPMTASDCYELGLAAHEYLEYAISIAWMTAAFHKYQDCHVCSFTEYDIVKLICRTYYSMGKMEDFLLWTEKSLKLKLTEYQKEESKRLIKHLKKRTGKDRLKKKDSKRASNVIKKPSDIALCLEETNKTINNKSLHCFYKAGPEPFIRLMSFKMEQLHLRPDVIIIHDVISDKEIEAFKRDASPKLEPGVLNNYLKASNKRVSGFATIYDIVSKVPARVSLRLSFITGYPVHESQGLEINNYGVGGFCVPHIERSDKYITTPRICLKNKSTVINPADWREMIGKATGLMFLSNVEQGGAIVFLKLGVTVFPEEGAVVTWNNLHRSGRCDFRIIHAHCPVLRGYKWTGTKLL